MNPINYRFRTSRRARRMWLTVQGDGDVIVTVPSGMPFSAASEFIRAKEDWVRGTIERLKRYKDDVVLPGGRLEYQRRKAEARALVMTVLARINADYGFSFNKIAIKNLRRNWGSCSEAGNLNFNYKLVFLPARLAEYIVVHELCHLGAFDHSHRFWELVARAVPDHKARRKELRRYHP